MIDVSRIFDNSPNNPANPDPNKEVYWGDQSWEEMIAGFVDLAIPVTMDPISLIRAPKPAAATTAPADSASNKQ